MNAFILPQNFITALAALALALIMSAAPHGKAFAEETGTLEGIIHVEIEQSLPENPAELRRLLSSPRLSAEDRRKLERALDDTYEELA